MTAPLPLEVAQARLMALAQPLPVERVDLASALGRYLAEPLFARRTQPAADLSAMDGFAVAGPDLTGPWQVIGESAAGHPFGGAVGANEAVRIATGALMPQGADAVITQEDVTRNERTLTLTGNTPSPPSKHVRHCGNDFLSGTELLAAGTRIGPVQLGLALFSGHTHLAIRRAPNIVIIDSGDELSADPENCALHQIPASNGAMLSAMLAAVTCNIARIGPVPDDLDALAQALEQAAHADIIVTTGGASVGDHDLLRPALAAWGAKLDFWRVAIKPGKPLLVATKGGQIVLGLPGNPVSSYVTAFLFLMPLLRHLLGAEAPLPRALPMRLASPAPAGGERREFLRGKLTADGDVEVLTMQQSGALAAMAAADVIIDRPANAAALPAGSFVPAYLI